jgi:hypothetical protein
MSGLVNSFGLSGVRMALLATLALISAAFVVRGVVLARRRRWREATSQ